MQKTSIKVGNKMKKLKIAERVYLTNSEDKRQQPYSIIYKAFSGVVFDQEIWFSSDDLINLKNLINKFLREEKKDETRV